jgi:folate-binding protein YgfZ
MNTLADYQNTLTTAGVFDLSGHGKLRLEGKDAASFLHNLCSNDVLGLKVGSGCEAFFLTVKAKIIAWAFIYREGDQVFWLLIAPPIAPTLFEHLNRHLISEQVEISDQTRELAQLHVAGPQAPTLLQGTRTIRRDLFGLPGLDVLGPLNEIESLRNRLVTAGAARTSLDVFEILRIEAGTPLDGVDFDSSTLAMEAGRTAQAISFSKGCYLGQEPVVRTRDLGHANRTLLGLKLAGASPVPAQSKIFRAGQEVGHVTSSVFSPRLDCAIALAYVRRGHQEPGTIVEVETPAGRSEGTVSSLPFLPCSG